MEKTINNSNSTKSRIILASLLILNSSSSNENEYFLINSNLSKNRSLTFITNSTRYPDTNRYSLDKLKSNKQIVEKFNQLTQNWNGYNGEIISQELIDKGMLLLSELDYQPKIFPTGRGSIQFEYEKTNGDYFEAELFNNVISYYYSKGAADKEGELQYEKLNEVVNEFFA